MIPKKPVGKSPARSRFSLATRLLCGGLRATLPAPPREEPWRNTKPKGKHGARRHR